MEETPFTADVEYITRGIGVTLSPEEMVKVLARMQLAAKYVPEKKVISCATGNTPSFSFGVDDPPSPPSLAASGGAGSLHSSRCVARVRYHGGCCHRFWLQQYSQDVATRGHYRPTGEPFRGAIVDRDRLHK